MRILVLGHTQELIVFADLMNKAGAEVTAIAALRPGYAGQINADLDAVAFSSETMTDSQVARIKQDCAANQCLICDITDGTDPLAGDTAPARRARNRQGK